MTPTTPAETKAQPRPQPRRLSPEFSEVLHMLSSLELKGTASKSSTKG